MISATTMLKLRYFIQSSSIASIETEEFLYLIQENSMIIKINKVFQIHAMLGIKFFLRKLEVEKKF